MYISLFVLYIFLICVYFMTLNGYILEFYNNISLHKCILNRVKCDKAGIHFWCVVGFKAAATMPKKYTSKGFLL